MTVQPSNSSHKQKCSTVTSSPPVIPVSAEEILDYSFREIVSEKLPEFATKFVARSGPKPKNEDEKVDAKAMKLNNNQLSDISGLFGAFSTVLNNPGNLTWIDLSFNCIRKIPKNFEEFANLKMLYLHGNNIVDPRQLSILANFRDLISFTIHGNPIEAEVPNYKWFVLAMTPSLKSINFTGLSRGDQKEADRLRRQMTRQQQREQQDQDM